MNDEQYWSRSEYNSPVIYFQEDFGLLFLCVTAVIVKFVKES